MRHIGALSLMMCVSMAGTALAEGPQPLTPGDATGFSGIEQRYVYAPPDKGSFEFDLRLGFTAAGEISIEEPSMCEGSAKARVDYDKAKNEVRLRVDYDGLPYRMDLAFEEDRSTPYNQFPVAVEDGKWQVWFVGKLFNEESLFWYDGLTGQLIGNEYDVDVSTLPPSAFPIPIPVVHMACITPLFEPNPNTLKASVDVTLDYDDIRDTIGTAGVLVGYVPYNLCAPDQVGPYYTNGGLPAEAAMNFDEILEGIHEGYGFALATSLEPDPKPEYIRARDNIMIGWTGGYPQRTPEGVRINQLTGEFYLEEECRTHEVPEWPAGYYNFCSPTGP